MSCKCGHQLKDHAWTFELNEKQPCLECDCEDFEDEVMNKVLDDLLYGYDVVKQ